MTTEILGSIWLIVSVPLATIFTVHYAIKGWKRDRSLVKLGEEKERELILRQEQDRILGRMG